MSEKIKIQCDVCDGKGMIYDIQDYEHPQYNGYIKCEVCDGVGFILVSPEMYDNLIFEER